MIRTAVCIGIQGDEDNEFDDLIGEKGSLRIDPKSSDSAVNWFNGGQGVNFTRKRVVEKDGIVKVFTKLGNVFKFKLEKA